VALAGAAGTAAIAAPAAASPKNCLRLGFMVSPPYDRLTCCLPADALTMIRVKSRSAAIAYRWPRILAVSYLHFLLGFILEIAYISNRSNTTDGVGMRTAVIGALLAALLTSAGPGIAAEIEVRPQKVTEWKAVYGRIETRDTVPARARIGGTVIELTVSEGDSVDAGQQIALVRDEKIAFQIAAADAQIEATRSSLDTAQGELQRTEALVKSGVATVQRLDQIRNQVDVARNSLASYEAQRSVLLKQEQEGAVLAPVAGRVLSVPVTRGAVVMGGEPVAIIGGGGFYLRLAIPERHAALLREGAPIEIQAGDKPGKGTLAKIYPQIENGRVIADVEVEALDTQFVDARVLVQVPVGEREAIMVPAAAVQTRAGVDFVTVAAGGGTVERAVVAGRSQIADGQVEILSGVIAGDKVVVE